VRDDLPRAVLHGVADADLAIVGTVRTPDRFAKPSTGSPTRACRCAFSSCARCGPSRRTDIRAFVQGAQHVFVVENNYTGQLERLIRAVVGPLDALHGVRNTTADPSGRSKSWSRSHASRTRANGWRSADGDAHRKRLRDRDPVMVVPRLR